MKKNYIKQNILNCNNYLAKRRTENSSIIDYIFFAPVNRLINITKVANNFNSTEEILEAKKLLWSLFANVLGHLIERRGSDKRSCSKANLSDISEALIKLDSEQKLHISFAKNLDKIPDGPDVIMLPIVNIKIKE